MTGFDWTGFVATLLATLVGAGVALLGSWILFHREQRERYEVRLTEELAKIVDVGAELIASNEEWRNAPRVAGDSMRLLRAAPSAERLRASITAATLVAKGKDLEIVRELRRAAGLASSRNANHNIAVVDDIVDVISHWRAPVPHGGFNALNTAREIPMPREHDDAGG